MKAIVVVDMDVKEGWDIRWICHERGSRLLRVAHAIKDVLSAERLKRTVISFVIYRRTNFWGQEAQLQFNITTKPGAENSQGCIVCDTPAGLADFWEHRHEDLPEPAFVKSRYDAFTNENLLSFLKTSDIQEVVLVGSSTNQCVLETAIGARRNGFHVTLLDQCTYPPFVSDQERYEWLRYVWLRSGVPFNSPLKIQIASPIKVFDASALL